MAFSFIKNGKKSLREMVFINMQGQVLWITLTSSNADDPLALECHDLAWASHVVISAMTQTVVISFTPGEDSA